MSKNKREQDEFKKMIENFSDEEKDTNDDSKVVKSENSDSKNAEKQGKKRKKKSEIKSRRFKSGALAAIITCIVIVAVIVVNMIVGLLVDKVPSLSNIDLTGSNTFKLSDETIDFLESLENKDKEITIKVLATQAEYEAGSEYNLKASTLLQKYSEYNKDIKIEWVDIAADPTFSSKYPNDTISMGNYIVECGDKHRMLTVEDIFEIEYDSTTGSQYIASMKLEEAVTTAILNVTSQNQEKVVILSGFGGSGETGLTNALEKNNYEVSTVNLLTSEIDEDVKMVVLYAPTVDFDKDSAKKITDYLYNNGEYGKNFMFIPYSDNMDLPNISSILEEWGMQIEKGIVAEMDSDRLLTTEGPFLFITDYYDETYTQTLKNPDLNFIDGYVQPVKIINENLAVPLLLTSEQAKLYPFNADESFNMDDQTAQQFATAAIGTQKGADASSNVLVFGSAFAFDEKYINISTYNNSAYIVNLVNTLVEKEDDTFTIEGKNLQDNSLGILTSQIQGISVVLVGIVPVLLLVLGLIIWLRRRNK